MGTDSQALTAEDLRAINISKALAADAVEKAGSGHPGTAISLAGVAYLLYQYEMTHDPADARWLGRDRLILSSGHASLLLYIQLVLAGYGLEVSDLEQLRQWGGRTPGHPEFGHTPGVETTTGPLGAGFTNAVGMAMAARFEHGLLDPAAPAGDSVFDHYVYTIMGDGCLQEGVTSEAASLAGAQELGNLIAIYDDNDITIEGSTDLAFTEDPSARFAAHGWHVLRAGCTPTVLKTFANMKPRRIVYVSCNPATLARDLAIMKTLGYEAREIQPVDLFPQTSHIETVVLMSRKDT